MKKKIVYALWAYLYILCGVLGFIEKPDGFPGFLFHAAAILFFLPGAWLLYNGRREGCKKDLIRIRVISLVSLALTLVFLVANLFAVTGAEAVALWLDRVLAVVSVPMYCAPNWAVSLFLWACLLVASLQKVNTD